jgi:hypothetical protein
MKTLRLALVFGTCIGIAAVGCGDDGNEGNDGPRDAAEGEGGSGGSGGAGGGGGSGGRGGSGGSATGGSGGSASGGSGGSSSGSGGSGGSASGGSGGSASGGSGGSRQDGGGTGGSRPDGGASDARASGDGPSGGGTAMMSFFVTSATSRTGDLGGLDGADKKCQELAAAVGAGGKTWQAYLSADMDKDGKPVNARDRIGKGPWHNAKGVKIAEGLADLHTRTGDAEVFLDETGKRINGQWQGSPTPNEHDILTGTNADGTLKVGFTCKGWTSASAADRRSVGHSDGMGPSRTTDSPYNRWNDAHLPENQTQNCASTTAGGGAGRFYCFATN